MSVVTRRKKQPGSSPLFCFAQIVATLQSVFSGLARVRESFFRGWVWHGPRHEVRYKYRISGVGDSQFGAACLSGRSIPEAVVANPPKEIHYYLTGYY